MKDTLKDFFGDVITRKDSTDFYQVNMSKQIYKKIEELRFQFPYLWLINISVFEHEYDLVKLRFFFINVDQYYSFNLDIIQPQGIEALNLSKLFRNALPLQEQIEQDHNIRFYREFKTRPNISDDTFLGAQNISLETKSRLFPQVDEIQIQLQSELVYKCSVPRNLFKIGLEQIVRGESLSNNYRLLENYFSRRAPLFSFLTSHAIETSLGLDITDRSKAIRMILLEMGRINDHLVFLYDIANQFRQESLLASSLLWLKRLKSLYISFCGNENGTSVIRVGGVIKDMSQVWLTRTVNEIIWLENSIKKTYRNLIDKESFKSHFQFRLTSKNIGAQWGVTGPFARAIGINLDLRKLNPIYFYKDIDFEIPIGASGTGHDLLIVRIEEIFESFRIIIQVLDNLPTGALMSDSSHFYGDLKEVEGRLDEDSYRQAVETFLDFQNVDACSFFESGEGIYSMQFNMRENKIIDQKISTPFFPYSDLFERVIKGSQVERVLPLWSMLNIDMKEAER